MVSYSQLLNMDTAKLTGAAEAAGGLSSTLSTRAGEVQSAADIPGGMWTGIDSSAASSLIGAQPSPLYDASDAFRRGRAALEDLVTGVEAAKDRLGDAQDLVGGTGITIGGDGTVTTPVVDNPTTAANNDRIAQQARQIIDAALKMAEEADQTATAAVQAVGMDVSESAIPDGKGDTPQEVKEWWDSLSDTEKQAFIAQHPEQIGNLDGIPAEARHQANMNHLASEIASGDAENGSQQLLDRIQNSWKGPESDRIYLLGFDPNGDSDAKVIAAIGNPDTADRTAVFVPGTGNDISKMGGNLDSMNRLQDATGGNTSAIVWLGYDAPDHIPAAVLDGYAKDGAPDLREFTRGLDATNSPTGTTTVIGHSYGSTVVGTADALGKQGSNDGLVARDIIAVGSPGMGYESPDRQGFIDSPRVDNTSDMHMDSDHIWAGAASNDVVTYTEVHGNAPHDWSFGGERFTTDGSSGHSEYFEQGGASLRNMAHIVNGEYDEVDHVGRRPG
ncbi:protein of unknown function DUF1023 [Stackebrandtia nassauensis DSM 44728]|uniref:DUF1023 domain-containing protein n=2 Tax=Stackebrandtia TaxID=283810 RepID=D3QB03_STANL|nr:protein of unknown function DUF1023 [Stackebrandtia nassauensis DSM 44728]